MSTRRQTAALSALAASRGVPPASVRLTLPYPPSVNRMYRSFNGRTILSREGRAYKDRVASLLLRLTPLDGDVAVVLGVYRPAKRGDLDNSLKMILDALRGVAFHDDKQVRHIDAERFDDKADPRVEVVVRPYAAGGRP